MGALEVVEGLAGRQLARVAAPLRLHRRRYDRTLTRGVVDEATTRRARGTWWGDDPRWYPGGTPPRLHNRVTPLVDGDAFFAALYEALTRARSYVYIAGWCLTPHIPLVRGGHAADEDTRLLSALSRAAARVPVRVLLWSGAPVLLQPTTRTMERVQGTIAEEGRGDLRCRLDHTAHVSHCHHQKTVVVDGQVAFVGGMDLTTFQGDRWDRPGHPLRAGPNWHDVQLRIEGEAVADVERNFRQRWAAATGDEPLPPGEEPAFEESWRTPTQIVRTIAAGVYPFAPRGEYGIHHAYTRALRGARRLIYLENQYLWSPRVMDALLAALARDRDEPLRIVIVLPARAYSGKYDNDRHVETLRAADRGRGIVSVYCPYAGGPTAGLKPFSYRPTYVHAKVAIIDDEWLTVGSANLNNRGLVTDSELNAVVRDPTLARALRVDLWAEHLALPRAEVAAADPLRLTDEEWPRRAAANAAVIARAERPLLCAVHRYECGRMPGTWLLEEAEVLTLEH